MANITTWKINRQIAELRDGTKGQPNGAVPLDSNGKIDLSLLKAYATQLPMTQDNAMTLAEYISRIALGAVVMPWEWTKGATPSDRYDFITYGTTSVVVGTKVYYGNMGFATEITSIPALTSVQSNLFCANINNILFISRSTGLYRSANGGTVFARVLDKPITSVAYDGTTYRASYSVSGLSEIHMYSSTDGVNWGEDSTWPASFDYVTKVWFVHNTWFASGHSSYYGASYLFRLVNGDWQRIADMADEWLDIIYDEADGGFVAINASKVAILYDGQNVWTRLYGFSGSVHCVCSNTDALLVGTSSGAFYYSQQYRAFMPCEALGSKTSWGQVKCIRWANGIFIVAGEELRFSIDGKQCWTIKTEINQCIFMDAVYKNDYWLVCSTPMNSITSSSGVYYMKGQNIQLPIYL